MSAKQALLPLALLLVPISGSAFELIAHRGVHQTYHREGLTNETCTATRIHEPAHDYLENTLESIERAFEHGADMVELDIHPTTEPDGSHKLVVFHDWTLDCRTQARCGQGCNCSDNGTCVTHGQSLAFLKTLDLGYGYTHDGHTFPFRGKFVGMMPTLKEVLDLLHRYPARKLLINQKDRMPRTVAAFLELISTYPAEVRHRVYFPRTVKGFSVKLAELEVPESIYQSKKAKTCVMDNFLYGWTGYFPKSCRNLKFFVPIRETLERIYPSLKGLQVTDVLWGWPDRFIERAHQHGSQVYASQVDSIEELHEMLKLDLDGIMTNRIERIGPALSQEGPL